MKLNPHWQQRLWSILFLSIVGLLLLGLNMRRGLNHDEHQFIASAALLAREGMLPYGDYPYFHMPTLVFIYAALFQISEHLLLSARLFSVACSWLTTVLIFIHVRRQTAMLTQAWRLLWPTLCILLLINNELFVYTSGRAWNHDLPVLLMVGAILVCSHGLTADGPKRHLFLSGLLMGFATSTRLSFAFTTFALALVTLVSSPRENRVKNSIAFGIGAMVGAGSAIYLLARFPSEFIFGNLEYIQLNTQYFAGLSDPPATMYLWGKFVNALSILIEPANLILVGLAFMMFGTQRSILWDNIRIRLLLVAGLFTLLGAFSATPSQAQYFYPLVPLVLLLVAEMWAYVHPKNFYQVGPILLAAALFTTLSHYSAGTEILLTPDEWYPNKLHRYAQRISTLAADGPTLTLSPIYPLESGQDIYSPLATGPFAWRVGHLLSDERRMEQKLIAPHALERWLADDPPRSILAGIDNDESSIEKPLLDYAHSHAYMPITMPDEGTLWLSPLHSWENVIQLGGHTLPREPILPNNFHEAIFYLQSRAPISQSLNIVVRAVGVDNVEIWRSERPLWRDATSQWTVEDVWFHSDLLTLPRDTVSGIYRVEMGFYDSETGDHLGGMVPITQLNVK